MAALECRSVCLDYRLGSQSHRALQDVDVTVDDQELVSVLGPSGCGKSSLLNIVAGFLRPTAGSVLIGGHEVSAPGRDRGVVFQEHALFPWMTVRDNIGYGPKVNRVPRARRAARIEQLTELVGLTGFETAYPKQLSGGMRQRVAIARALANEPEVLLMDEPFSALDEQTRRRMQGEFVRIWQETNQTVLFVTHSVDESVLLSDRVIVMDTKPGRVREIVAVTIPRPRDDSHADYVDLKRQIADILYQIHHADDER